MLKPKLLLVDDEPEILELLTLFFPEFETKTALNTELALKLLHSGSFDVLVTDIKMPGESGFVLIDHVKATLPSLPIIVITGHQQEVSASEKAKVAHWLLKPFRREAIRHAVLDSLTKR